MPANIKLVDFFDQYLSYFCQKSKNTLRAKRADLNAFIEYATEFYAFSKSNKLKLKHWDSLVTKRYLEHCSDLGASHATKARRLATLKHAARAMGKYYPNFVDPTNELKTPRKLPRKHRFVSQTEEKLVRKQATKRVQEKESFIRLRNTVLFELLLGTGLRLEELRLLKAKQLDQELQWITSVRSKSGQFRNVPIPKSIKTKIEAYLPHRKDKLAHLTGTKSKRTLESLPLFPSSYGAKPGNKESFLMGEKTIWRAINELSAVKHLNPHLLRHTFAKRLVSRTNNIDQAQKLLGHSDRRITKEYTGGEWVCPGST